jgi:HlyD family secretion protein
MFKKIIRYTLLLALAGIFIWTIWFLYSKSQTPDVTFKTEKPSVSNIVKKTVATGSVVPRREVIIKSQVSGIIDELYVLAGKMVKKGDVIAKVRIIPNMLSLNEAEGRVSRAKIEEDRAQADFDSIKICMQIKLLQLSSFSNMKLLYVLQSKNHWLHKTILI